MTYHSTHDVVQDLEKHGHLIRIQEEIDPNLEAAEIHRRVFEAGGPALYFENIKGSDFPAVSNIFGNPDRARFVFRKTLKKVRRLVEVRADPTVMLKAPHRYLSVPFSALKTLPSRNFFHSPVTYGETTIEKLPLIKSWPDDGGAFITLPQVYTEDSFKPGIMNSNLGMYRIQLTGNQYTLNETIGMHYQIHRGIGVHHSHAIQKGQPLRASIFIGGNPAATFAAIMPLPEGLPEVVFAGALAGRRFRFMRKDGHVLAADADFVITGTVELHDTLPEGPFGDHLGYYSLVHPFPYLRVEKVYHRKNAVWPFTVVGRPPAEDTMFGMLIHELTGPMVPASIPGLKSMHAVDAAGVHPLLLAIGSERYVPYEKTRKPREILTIASAILGFNQASLAKYLFITAEEDNPELDIHDIGAFFRHVFERIDFSSDLHFHTNTTIDTLDYTGTGLNEGSKVIIAAAGPKRRDLCTEIPADFKLPRSVKNARLVLPGIVAVQTGKFSNHKKTEKDIAVWSKNWKNSLDKGIAVILLCDDSQFVSESLQNFLWATFTRSNPSHDIYGVDSFIEHKHWGCHGSLIIDMRRKPGHAPPLIEDKKVQKKVDAMFAKGGALHGII